MLCVTLSCEKWRKRSVWRKCISSDRAWALLRSSTVQKKYKIIDNCPLTEPRSMTMKICSIRYARAPSFFTTLVLFVIWFFSFKNCDDKYHVWIWIWILIYTFNWLPVTSCADCREQREHNNKAMHSTSPWTSDRLFSCHLRHQRSIEFHFHEIYISKKILTKQRLPTPLLLEPRLLLLCFSLRKKNCCAHAFRGI